MTNLCRVRTLVRLHVLYACEAASTACSNSEEVVSGTLVKSVWDAYGAHSVRARLKWNGRAHTGSTTSIHFSVLLSTNSPPMKFLVFAPVALVPFQSWEIFSAFDFAVALSPLRAGRDAAVAIARTPRSWAGKGGMAR